MRLLSQFLAPGEGPVRRNLPSLPQAEGGMSGVRRRCGGSSVVSSARGLGTLNTAPPNPSALTLWSVRGRRSQQLPCKTDPVASLGSKHQVVSDSV